MYRLVMHYIFYVVRTSLYTIFFVNISFVAFFLGLGGLGAENRTSLSSKQSNFSTWKSWQKIEDLNNTIDFKPTHPQA